MTTKINTQELGKDLQAILESKGITVKAKEYKDIVEEFIDAIFERVNNGEIVKLGAYADLEPRTRSERKGYNPKLLKELKDQGVPKEDAKKQAEIKIVESRAVGLKPHKKLKDLLKG